MDIKFNCPSCAGEILSLERYKGQKITCLHCQDKVLVPEVSNIEETEPVVSPQRELTETEKATEQIKSDLSSIKFVLFIIMIGILVLVFVSVMYYSDYCKAKEAIRDALKDMPETSDPYKY